MSQYVNFYIRVNNSFIPIADYSRNNYIYRVFEYLPYEKIKALTYDDFIIRKDKIKGDREYAEKMIAEVNAKKEFIAKTDASLEEKLQQYNFATECIAEYQDDIESCNFALDFIYFLEEMIDAIRYNEDGLNMDNDYNHYLYAGIEAIGSIENIIT